MEKHTAATTTTAPTGAAATPATELPNTRTCQARAATTTAATTPTGAATTPTGAPTAAANTAAENKQNSPTCLPLSGAGQQHAAREKAPQFSAPQDLCPCTTQRFIWT